MIDDKGDPGGRTMKLKSLLLGALLAAVAAAQVWADGTPAWMQDNQLTFGVAIGKGFVEKSDSEIAALQYRIEFRINRIYVAYRGSWVAQACNTRPNPTESSFLVGLSLPFDSGRNRVNLGVGAGKTSAHGRTVAGLPCELRVKFGLLGLAVFSNFNRNYSFQGVCASFDFPIRIFRK
jgi:hypothetical protein